MTTVGPSSSAVTTSAQLKHAIVESMKKTPRFLFRFWHSNSCRQKDLGQDLFNRNTITPLYFKAHPQVAEHSPDLFSKGLSSIKNTTELHLNNDESTETYFSSWTHSLPLLLAKINHIEDKVSNIHIAVLDTHELTSKYPHNVVVNATTLGGMLGKNFSSYRHVFLVYGVLSGSYMSTVPHDVLNNDQLIWGQERLQSSTTTEDRLKDAVRLGAQFGKVFAAPVAAHFMTMFRDDLRQREEVADWLQNSGLELASGFESLHTDIEHQGHLEVLHAALLLRRASRLRSQVNAGLEFDSSRPGWVGLEIEKERAVQALKECDCVPAEVAEHYERMVQGNVVGLGR